MSNEELAVKVKAGDDDALLILWEAVERFVKQQALIFFNKRCGLCQKAGVTVEDLFQSGFLSVYNAARGFNLEKECKFTSYLTYHLKRDFLIACGLRNKPDPLNDCGSLDNPLPGTEDYTLADTIEDSGAGQAFEDVDHNSYLDELHRAMGYCLNELEEQQRRCIVWKYYEGKTIAAIGEREGISSKEVLGVQNKALRALRRPNLSKRLLPFLDEIIEARAYQGTGFSTWSAYGSTPERILESPINRGCRSM